MLIFADIAGQFKTFEKMSRSFIGKERIICLGDLVDRGPESSSVIQYIIENKLEFVIGNHEDMMIDWWNGHVFPDYRIKYSYDLWLNNGGVNTLQSYNGSNIAEKITNMKEHIIFLEDNKKVMIETDKLILTHAPYNAELPYFEFIWNREEPKDIPNKLQLFGHNSYWGVRSFKREDGSYFAMCLDNSGAKKLTAIHINENTLEYKILSEDYI